MENLKNVILEEFGLDLKLKHFGNNNARNNVFLGEDEEKSFIIKLEYVNQLEQVKLSIKVAFNLLTSSVISLSRYLKTKKGKCFSVI